MKEKLFFKSTGFLIFIAFLISLMIFIPNVKAITEYRIVGLGDSIMVGYGVKENETFLSHVKNKLSTQFIFKANVVSKNLGVNGLDTEGLIFKLNRDNEFINEIKTANLIEINIGGNDSLIAMVDFITEGLGLREESQKLIEEELAKKGDTFEAFYARSLEKIHAKYPGYLTEEEINRLFQEEIAKLDIDFLSIFGNKTLDLLTLPFEQLTDKMNAAANTFSKKNGNWEKVINRIRYLNPDADIIVLTTFNPYKSLDAVLKILGSKIVDTVDIVCNAENLKIKEYAVKGNYKVADISTTFSSLPGLLLTGIVSSDPHPNKYGHLTIYGLQSNLLRQLKIDNSTNIIPKSTVNTLSAITIDNKVISNFNSNILEYSITVPNSTSNIKISGTRTNSTSSFVTNYGPKSINLNIGSNQAILKVKSESGEVKTYKININRLSNQSNLVAASSNNNLLALTIVGSNKLKQTNSSKVGFDKNVTDYIVEVNNYIQNIDIITTLEDPKSTVMIMGKDNLIVGSNLVKVIVTAENGEEKIYTINVIRNQATEISSSSTIAEQLEITKLDNIKVLSIMAAAEDMSKVIDQEVINSALNKNIDINITVKSGDKILYVWTIPATGNESVTTNLNYDIIIDDKNDLDKVQENTDESNIMTLKLSETENEIPGTIKVYVGDKYSEGTVLYLNSYNNDTGKINILNKEYKVSGQYIEFENTTDALNFLSPNKIDGGLKNKWLLIGTMILTPLIILGIFEYKKIKANNN